jgi:sarcosine oxidase subunit beta
LEETPSSSELDAMRAFVARRLPVMANAPMRRSHTILYDVGSDGLPLVGAVPGVEGVYVAAGLGEQAVAAAPAVGRALAEIVVDRASAVDLSDFRPARDFSNSRTRASGHAE